MQGKKGLKMLAGVVALAASGGVFAQVDTSTHPDLVLHLLDTTSGASYTFDTGLSVATFDGTTSSQAYTLSGTNYSAFQSAIATGDNIVYSVVGGLDGSLTGTGPAVTIDTTGQNVQTTKSNGQAGTALQQIFSAYAVEKVPVGGDFYISGVQSQAPGGGGWFAGGYEANFNNALVQTDDVAIGTPLAFYQITNTASSGLSKTGATAKTFAGTWDLTGGVLQYTSSTSPVPLPAPLLLLLSGLGLMGVIARRGQSGASDTSFNGAAA